VVKSKFEEDFVDLQAEELDEESKPPMKEKLMTESDDKQNVKSMTEEERS